MKRVVGLLLLLGIITVMPLTEGQRDNRIMVFFAYPVAIAAGDYERLNINLKKLKEAMKSMKQFDELEQQGLPKRQVNLMRNAMENKISQMMTDVIAEIQKFR